MKKKILHLCHLYPNTLNMYGDRGNVMVLKKRCSWRGFLLKITELFVGDDNIDFSTFDLLYIGGGGNRQQQLVYQDLLKRAENLRSAVQQGVVLLAISSGFQLMGISFGPEDGTEYSAVGVFDAYSITEGQHMVGQVVVKSSMLKSQPTVVGFENHSGRTYLGQYCSPFGQVIKGIGNNGEDGTDGAVSYNAFGTYLHGAVLPNNPHFADLLLRRALQRRDDEIELTNLTDEFEWKAHRSALKRAGVSYGGEVFTA